MEKLDLYAVSHVLSLRTSSNVKGAARTFTSGRCQQNQLCYIRPSIRIVTDKRARRSQEKLDLMAARAKPKPGRESLPAAKSNIPKSHSIT